MPQGAPLSESVRRWTLTLGQLRSRALRVKRRSGDECVASDAFLDEALDLSNSVLLELAGAEMELKKSRDALHAERRETSALFDRMPVAAVMTDAAGVIIAANRRASLLLNVSARHLAAKPLLPFSQDRTRFLVLLRSLPLNGAASTATVSIRPRERRAVNVDVAIIPRTTSGPTEWLWFLTPEKEHRSVDGGRLEIRRDVEADADTRMSAYSGQG